MAIQPSVGVSNREPWVFVNNQGFYVWTQRRILPQPLLQQIAWFIGCVLVYCRREVLSSCRLHAVLGNHSHCFV